MTTFSCPKCGTEYQEEDSLEGMPVSCAICDCHFVVPKRQATSVVYPDKSLLPSTNSTNAAAAVFTAPSTGLPPRQRRLFADQRSLVLSFSTFPLIHIEEMQGNPPERYVISYLVRGIERIEGDRIIYRNNHLVEIRLPGTYPRTPPTCKMLTPIFHPNIEPAIICIGDHWTAGERLRDLVVRIGEMITYQAYNLKSPLDGEAAMWADLHVDMLPIDNRDLVPPDP